MKKYYVVIIVFLSILLPGCEDAAETENEGNDITKPPVEVVDNTAPEISAMDNLIVEAGDTEFTLPTCVVRDNLDISIQCDISGDTVDISTVGTYTVFYDATDIAGNQAEQVSMTVEVVDNNAPEISAMDNLTVEAGNPHFNLPNCIVSDSVDKTVQCDISGDTVDISTVGTYTVFYDAADASGNQAEQVSMTIEVVDTTAPVINLINDGIVIGYDTTFNPSDYYTVTDNVNHDIECTISGDDVDVSVLGTYEITYHATDESSNDAFAKTLSVQVADTTGPELTSVPEFYKISQGSHIDLSSIGITALDDYDGDITESITVDVNDTSSLEAGSYDVEYTVTDGAGNESSKIVELIVEIPTVSLGDTIIFDDLEIFFKSTQVEHNDNTFSSYDDAVLLEVEVKNLSDDIHRLKSYSFDAFGPNGLGLSKLDSYFDSATITWTELLPNAVIKGHISFEYTTDGIYTIEFSNFFSVDYVVEVNVSKTIKTQTNQSSNIVDYSPNNEFYANSKYIGEVLTYDELEIFVKGTEVKPIDNMFVDYEDAAVIEVEIRNISDHIHSLNMFSYTAYGPSGLQAKDVSAYIDGSIDYLGDMLPNAVMNGYLSFEYSEDGIYTLVIEDIVVQIEIEKGTIIDTNTASNFPSYTPNTLFEEQMLALGDTFIFDDLEITLNSYTVEQMNDYFTGSYDALLVDTTVKNIGDEANSLNMFYHDTYGPNGLNIDHLYAMSESNIDYMDDMLPGASVTGYLIYEYHGDGTYVYSFGTLLDDDQTLVKLSVAK